MGKYLPLQSDWIEYVDQQKRSTQVRWKLVKEKCANFVVERGNEVHEANENKIRQQGT